MDTNILVNALFHNDRYAQRLLSCIASNKIRLVISEAIAIEYLDIVMLHALEAGLTLEYAKKPLRKLVKIILSGKHVVPRIKLKVVADPEDNKFFECAHEADVTVIVTQDGDVSAVEQVLTCSGKQINVYSPWQFFQIFGDL